MPTEPPNAVAPPLAPPAAAAAAQLTDDELAKWWASRPAALKPTTNAADAPTTNSDSGRLLPFYRRWGADLLDALLDPRRRIDEECGYPADAKLTPELYLQFYRRVGVANRIVRLMPEESWRLAPTLYETEDQDDETEFETAWDAVLVKHKVWYRLHQIDRVSGIGRFGVVLLGLDDGKELSEPAEGIDPKTGKRVGEKTHELLSLRCFSEASVKVQQRETDLKSPRAGLPLMYSITFETSDVTGTLGAAGSGSSIVSVHWTRVVHVAEARDHSEVYGTPRLEATINPSCDLRKTVGGSTEMHWKGGFPGIALTLSPGVGPVNLDIETVRQQFDDYQNGLQRFLGFVGMEAKSLTPQIASPKDLYDVLVAYICLILGVPKRVFLGSEQAELASSQDAKRWNEKISKRNEEYVTPWIIREFVDRLIALGILPEPLDGPAAYQVSWPDPNATTDMERADLGTKRTAALAQYVQSGADGILPLLEWLIHFLDFDEDEAKAIVLAHEEHVEGLKDEQANAPAPPPPIPTETETSGVPAPGA